MALNLKVPEFVTCSILSTSVIKSIEIDSNHLYGIGKGCNNPCAAYVEVLV